METATQTATVVAQGEGRQFNMLGHPVTVKLSKQETNGKHYVFEVFTPPGHGIPPHVHDREDEMIYVVEGEYGVMLGDANYVVNTGGHIFFPRHIPHAFQNIGSKAGITLWTVEPGGNFEEFFEQLSALPTGEPDLIACFYRVIFRGYSMQSGRSIKSAGLTIVRLNSSEKDEQYQNISSIFLPCCIKLQSQT